MPVVVYLVQRSGTVKHQRSRMGALQFETQRVTQSLNGFEVGVREARHRIGAGQVEDGGAESASDLKEICG